MLEKFFEISERHTTIKTELLAGVTTFLSMAYILAINPIILGNVMDAGAVFTATALASAIATFIMGLWANYPVALSSGMGLNAYFAFSVCMRELKGTENPFQIALAAILVEGLVFILLSAFEFREKILDGLPSNLKRGITAGIGIFIAFIGMEGAGIIVSNPATLVDLCNFKNPLAILCLLGFLFTSAMEYKKVKGGILWGILITWGLGILAQASGWYVVDTAKGALSLYPNFSIDSFIPPSLEPTMFKFDFTWAASHIIEFVAIVFSFLFVDLFDTVGVVLGVAQAGNLLDEKGKLPRANRVFLSDAIGTVTGACLGTSTVTSFAESNIGIAVGGRTGLTAIVVGFFFLLSLFLAPIFLSIPMYAVSTALIMVGVYMVGNVTKMDFNGDIAESVSGFFAVVMMPLTYSIANGIMFGVLSWVILKVLIGKAKEIPAIMYVVAFLFMLKIGSLIFA